MFMLIVGVSGTERRVMITLTYPFRGFIRKMNKLFEWVLGTVQPVMSRFLLR